MSWSDLERLVADAESSPALQQVLRQCHSRQELLRTARQLGYRLTRADLQNAWLEHHNAGEVQGADSTDLRAAGGS
jgi:hypothetical protein